MRLKLRGFLWLALLYGISFFVINALHFTFLPVEVVLYAALLDVVLAGVVTALAYLAFPAAGSPLTGMEAVLSLAVCFLAATLYAVTVPTIVDRSLSFYLLEKLQQRGGAIRRSALDDIFKEEYLFEHKLVEVRLTEQLASGTIVIENGCVKLTARGERMANFARLYRSTLLPKKRRLLDRTTDDLTDPFRAGAAPVPHRCRPE